jgi:hypothetical protein
VTPSETSPAVRDAVAAVYEDLQAEGGGAHAHLKAWALAHPTDFYRLWARLSEEGGGGPAVPPEILAAFEKLTPERRAALKACLARALRG